MRDIAYVHIGAPPQTNVVHVDGKNAVLLSIIKSGATSTLSIISGVKSLLPQIGKTLPPGLNLTTSGDQSGFVTAAVVGVVREGVIAASLTALMILLFLGSWRSTLIITVSIPLSVLASVAVLAGLGETINVMTLGGLALAVGILVDEATVTIENINSHLEMGKEITTAIIDGAMQIATPAFVSMMCICIAFVPMLSLGGVAGYLFRPMAEAVVFAVVASFLLSRTLVPAMALALLRTHAPRAEAQGDQPAGAGRRILAALTRFQHRFEAAFESLRQAYTRLLALGMRHPRNVIVGFLAFSLLSFLLIPALGQDFFPDVDGGQIKIHVRAQTGSRIEETTRLTDRIGDEIHQIIPPSELDSVVDNIGLSVSGINMAYNNSGTIGTEDADVLVTLKPDHKPTADYVRRMREILPQRFPGTSFAFLPADIVNQILNFGSPAPIDLQVVGSNLPADRVYAEELLGRIRRIPGIADARIQQAFQEPNLDVNVDRSLAGLVGINERDTASAMLTTLAGSSQVYPTFWLDPKTSVSYPVEIQAPQPEIDTLDGLKNLPVTSGTGVGGPQQLLGGVADFQRSPSNAIVSHYNVRPVIDIYATPQGRDLGGVAADIQKVIKAKAKDVPVGATVALRGQVTTMTSGYRQLYAGLAVAVVFIFLLIVVNFQSWLDPLIIVAALPTALAGIVWMLFATGTTVSVPALTGAIMCMGVATANSVLMISFARERLADGIDAMAAGMEAGSTRLRPVLMTALAMVLGMLPMAIEPGQNSPLGRAVIGGLLFATCATVFLVPILFGVIHRRSRKAADAPAPPHAPTLALPLHP